MYLFKIQKKWLWEQGIEFVEEYRTEEKTILKKKLQYKLNLSEINDKIENRRINQKAGGAKKYFRLFLFYRFGCQNLYSITFIGKLHKRNMESFSLCNGDKTHEAWKPLLNTIHAFRGLSECLHNETCNIFLCNLPAQT